MPYTANTADYADLGPAIEPALDNALVQRLIAERRYCVECERTAPKGQPVRHARDCAAVN